ncbi:actin-like ATPase domain-containing protein [Trichoderma sp. SZMC 28015]
MAIITPRTKLLVGIDYGTTYSGICFALSNASDFKDINTWTKYPGAASHSAEHTIKAPTRVAFPEENDDLDRTAWGYEVEAGMKSYSWTKLLLDDTLPSEFDATDTYSAMNSEIMRLPNNMSAKDVAREYLTGMRKMFDKNINQHLGAHKLDDLPMEFWITVPASWNEKAKLLTKTAAMEAGFGKREIDSIKLIPEPEAAAHMALKTSIHRFEGFVKPKTGILVCDCGGGTVDITTYEIERTEPTLTLREIVVGAAGKCGGTYVDRNLLKLLSERFGEAFTSLPPQEIGPGSNFMDSFESKKKDFKLKNLATRRDARVQLFMPRLKKTPDLERYYERRSHSILLSKADFQTIFDPVIDKIIKLIEDQINRVKRMDERPIETIILVGGFGSSPYLNERLTDWCEPRGIRLTIPATGAWSAVVCGAVLRGLEGSIVREKKCRKHYGHALAKVYNPSLHSNYNAQRRSIYKDVMDRVDRLTGFMFWQIPKGTLIDSKTEINSEFVNSYRGPIIKSGEHFLYSCGLDAAPGTIDDNRVETIGRILYTLHDMDWSQVPNVKRLTEEDGETYTEIPLVLNIRLDDEVGHLVFRILCNGREAGKARLDLDY